nr:MAG TPA: hypothetical protein [Caudoviricetes sp.]
MDLLSQLLKLARPVCHVLTGQTATRQPKELRFRYTGSSSASPTTKLRKNRR